MPEHTPGSIVVSLPVADRPTSSRFYRALLGVAPPGEPQDDGEPEPLRFPLGDRTDLMLIPTGGFGWVIGEEHAVAERGQVEVLLSRETGSEPAVDSLVEAAAAAGGTVVTAAGPQPWGYAAVLADPDGHLWQVITDPLI